MSTLLPSIEIRKLRRHVGYPQRYMRERPAWLDGWRHDFREDIEAEYLYDQRQAEESARRES